MSKKTVKLRIYKGKEVLKRSDDSIANENEILTLTYDDLQWKKHLQNLLRMGVCLIDVEAVYQGEKEIDAEDVKKEIEELLKPNYAALSSEEKSIAELKKANEDLKKSNEALTEKFEALMNRLDGAKGTKVEEKKATEEITVKAEEVVKEGKKEADVSANANVEANESVEDLQKKYAEKFGKEPSNAYKNNVAWLKTQLETEA